MLLLVIFNILTLLPIIIAIIMYKYKILIQYITLHIFLYF
jgi:hypothetical protein